MGRKRTQLTLSPAERAEAHRLLQSSADPRMQERVRFALETAAGQFTLEDLARRFDRTRSTIQNWLGRFRSGGLAGLLERAGGPGRSSPMAEAEIQNELLAGLKTGRWTSAAHVAAWLRETHDIKRSRKSVYYWFQKHSVRAPSARP